MDAPLRVLVIVYPEHETAVRAYEEVRRLDHEGKVKIEDAAVVTAHDDGQLEVVSTHRHAVKSAGKAAFWGLLIGGVLTLPVVGLVMAGGAVGLAAHKSDRGKEDAFADRVRSILLPGRTALFVTGRAGTATPEEIIAVLAPFGGELAQSSLLSETEAKMRHALREEAKEAAAAEAGTTPSAKATPSAGVAPADEAPGA